MRVLVTGGSGFIGSHLVKALVEEGYDVVVVDIKVPNCSIEGVKFLKLDIRNYPALRKAIKSVELIVHLAALIDAHESVIRPNLYHEINVNGTLNILRLCKDLKIRKLIFTSSAAVYGEARYLPIDEEHSLNPLTPYGATKVACEAYISAFHSSYGISAIILRVFNAYGPKQLGTYAGVISNFIKRALSNKPLIIYGDGKQTRDFVYVSDVVKAIIKALKSNVDFGVFNVGSGKPTSINELAELIKELTNRELKIVHENDRIGDVRHSYANIKRIKEVLEWVAEVELREGLRKTIEWYKSWMS